MNIDEALIERIIRESCFHRLWLRKRPGADRIALLQEIIRTACNQ